MRRAIVGAVVAIVMAFGAWGVDQYVFGNRCGGRLAIFRHEPVVTQLPPDTVKVGESAKRSQCGITATRGFAEVRLASALSQAEVEEWYRIQFSDVYGMARLTDKAFGGIVKLTGRRHQDRLLIVSYVDIGTRTSRDVFPHDAGVVIPAWAQTTISVVAGDL